MSAESRLEARRNLLLAKIYESAVSGGSIRELHRELLKTTFKRNYEPDRLLTLSAVRMASKIAKSADPYEAVCRAWPLLGTVIYGALRAESSKDKDGAIKAWSDESLSSGEVICLASWHADSAEDHKDAQGRFYVFQGWRSYVSDPEERRRIEDFIKRERVMSVEDVMGAPTYFITRPNCRHWMKAMTIDEAESAPITALLDKYGMRRMVGERGHRHPLPQAKIVAKRAIDKYSMRLAFHERLLKIRKTDQARRDVARDKGLIAKWRAIYKNG